MNTTVPQYSTPTFTLEFEEEDLDLTEAQSVYVTLTSGKYSVTKTGDALRVQAKQIDVHLEQSETGKMQDIVYIQMNAMIGGERVSSEVLTVEIGDQLLKKVIE